MKITTPPDAKSPLSASALPGELGVGVPVLAFDADKYRKFVEASGWTDAEQTAYLAEIWKICVMWADLAFRANAQANAHEISTLEVESSPMLGFELNSANNAFDVTERAPVARMDS